MFSWGARFGLGRRTFLGNEGMDDRGGRLARFNSEVPGFIPSSSWVLGRGHTSVEAETINAGIGQGAFTVTSLQLARLTAAMGNGGKMFQPQLVQNTITPAGDLVRNFKPRLENQIILKPEVRDLVMRGLHDVVSGGSGTARSSHIPGIDFGGKTGTAQVVSLDFSKNASKMAKRFEDHALFVGMAPLNDPKIAIAVIVENGGHGGTTAAPIAKALVQEYLGQDIELVGESGKDTLK